MIRKLLLRTQPTDNRPVFVAGSFNNWNPESPHYQMTPTGQPGEYSIQLEIDPNHKYVEYKYTRGGWASVELSRFGEYVPNRTIVTTNPSEYINWVQRWAADGLYYKQDLLPVIEVIDEAFEIPQLIRTRRIAALLPRDYYSNTNKRYPVLYLQDGQNLFDDYAPYGSWGVNKRMAMMAEMGMGDLIIISIDHAENQRMGEFLPSFKTTLGRGDGKKYVRFLADTLKPYIDSHFRTLPAARHTGIGGSSLGGLISIYAGMMYPEVYDKLMIFSPSLWVAPNIPFRLIDLANEFSGRIYLYGGAAESSTMVPNLERFKAEVEKQEGTFDVAFRLETDPHGQHNEARWGQEFPKAVEWLFFKDDE